MMRGLVLKAASKAARWNAWRFMARCWIGIVSVRGWLTGGANSASTTARAVSFGRIAACSLHCTLFLGFAEVLYVVPFTCTTNEDHSDAVQACSAQLGASVAALLRYIYYAQL